MKKTFGLGPSDWVVLEGPWHSSGLGKGPYLPCSIKVYTPFEADCENPSSMVKFQQRYQNSHRIVIF